jgi:hypothetical protein
VFSIPCGLSPVQTIAMRQMPAAPEREETNCRFSDGAYFSLRFQRSIVMRIENAGLSIYAG